MKSDEDIIKQIIEIEQLTRKLRIDLEERSSQQQNRKLKIGDRVKILNPKEDNFVHVEIHTQYLKLRSSNRSSL